MSLFELFILAVGLSMDAFAVAVCKGLAMRRFSRGRAAAVGAWFGGFQAAMPLAGYLLGVSFAERIERIDHWIVFVLLSVIGLQMIREALTGGGDGGGDDLSFREMLVLSVATSIDALAVGVTFAFLSVRILPAVSLIGAVTFTLSAAGVAAGHAFGTKYRAGAEILGGVILILLGTKILLEHLGIIG